MKMDTLIPVFQFFNLFANPKPNIGKNKDKNCSTCIWMANLERCIKGVIYTYVVKQRYCFQFETCQNFEMKYCIKIQLNSKIIDFNLSN